MLAMAERAADAWRPPIVRTTASSGQGLDAVADAIEEHRAWLSDDDRLARRRLARARDEIEALALTALRERWHADEPALDALAARVAARGARLVHRGRRAAGLTTASSGEPAPSAYADRL